VNRYQESWYWYLDEKEFWLSKKYLIEGKQRKRSVKIHLVRLWVWTESDVVGPKVFRVVPSFRNGCLRYSISALIEPPKEKWPMLKLRPDPPPKLKRIESLDSRAFADWLRRRLGDDCLLEMKGADHA
jgi:hypothetical protein